MSRRASVVVVAALALGPAAASAQPSDAAAGDVPGELPAEDADFGAALQIEAIEVTGNDATSAHVIRRALPFAVGTRLRAGDPRLRAARYKLLALGFFEDVALAMRRGGARGQVVIEIAVVERGTVVLNRLWFGTSTSSVAWLGADVTERNLLGRGVALGLGAIGAGRGAIDGSRGQVAGEVRLGAPTVFGSRWGWGVAVTGVRGAEPYRIAGDGRGDAAAEFASFDYSRLGGRATASYDLTGFTRLQVAARLERLRADLPDAPTRALAEGVQVPLDLGLARGVSHVRTLSVALDRDTRQDPALPHDGGRLQLLAEGGVRALAGDYHFATLVARADHYWPLRGGTHALGLRGTAAASLGDAPRFDRIHLSEVNRMVAPRPFGLAVSAEPAPDLLGTAPEPELFADVGAGVVVEYVAHLFRRRAHVYGGDLFLGVGGWGTWTRDVPAALGTGRAADLVVDAGLRLDTELGVFELTLANAFGRVAW